MDAVMTPIRDMVEHSFAKCVTLWSFMDFSKKHMLWSAAKEDEWLIVAFLTNLHVHVFITNEFFHLCATP